MQTLLIILAYLTFAGCGIEKDKRMFVDSFPQWTNTVITNNTFGNGRLDEQPIIAHDAMGVFLPLDLQCDCREKKSGTWQMATKRTTALGCHRIIISIATLCLLPYKKTELQ